jgi:hypothetical protein
LNNGRRLHDPLGSTTNEILIAIANCERDQGVDILRDIYDLDEPDLVTVVTKRGNNGGNKLICPRIQRACYDA